MKNFFIGLLLILSFTIKAQQKPNIVFFLADDLTNWDIGVYGNKDSKTPAIDKLATQGMRFTKCYQSSPMCSPTRQNILTGLSPFRSGAYPNHTCVNGNVASVVNYLTPLGYNVALSGKRHFGPAENFNFISLGVENQSLDPNFDIIDNFLKTRSGEAPFCLFVCSNQPHTPWNKGNPSLFDRDKITLPPYYANLPITRDQYRKYLAEINFLDNQVKQTLDLLDKYKLSDNTIFVFASEQGNSFPFAKWTCYNAGLKSALIVRWPGKVKPNTVSNALVEYSDITPTFIDIAGGKLIDSLDGKSIVPVLTGKTSRHKKYTFGQMTTRGIQQGAEYYPIRSASNGKFRYIINLTPNEEFKNVINTTPFFKEWIQDSIKNPKTALLVRKHLYRPAEELYNDETDPYNQNNLINDGRYLAIKNELKSELSKWMTRTNDRGIITELLALEHMPLKASHYNIIIDTNFHQAIKNNLFETVEVVRDGYYTFYLKGKGEIKIDNKVIVAKNNKALESDERYGVIALKKGLHRYELSAVDPNSIIYSGPQMGLKDLKGNRAKRENKKEAEE